jgi:hypothetical protein
MSIDRRWLTSSVIELCQEFIASKEAGTRANKANFDLLPILADAIEESGCNHIQLLTLFRARVCVNNFWSKAPEAFLNDCVIMAERFFETEPITLIGAALSAIRKGEFVADNGSGKLRPSNENILGVPTSGVALTDAEPDQTVILLPCRKAYST